VIRFEDVTKIYPPSTVGLEKVSLHIEKGEFVFLVGPSGSGKSTFIRLLIKELEPDRGKVSVGGRDLATLRKWKVPYLRRIIGCVFQDFKLLTNKTAFENVMYALVVTGQATTASRKKAAEILSLVGLEHKSKSYPNELSGGEQQRVSIARAFVNHPPLLIADEPTGDLDGHHAVAVSHQQDRHHGSHGHTRPGDGGPDAPARDRARRRQSGARPETRRLWGGLASFSRRPSAL
jgi:cell division transport system ATP-binding protein